MDAEEAIIKSVFSDENYLGFWYYLYDVYNQRAECAMTDGDHDEAIRCLKIAKDYAIKVDSLFNTGKHSYTCAIFCDYEDEWCVEESVLNDTMNHWRWKISTSKFDAIREREDFKALAQ